MDSIGWASLMLVAFFAVLLPERLAWLIAEYRKSFTDRPRRTAWFVLVGLLLLGLGAVALPPSDFLFLVFWVLLALLWGPVIVHMMARGRNESDRTANAAAFGDAGGAPLGNYAQCSFARDGLRCQRVAAARGRCREPQR